MSLSKQLVDKMLKHVREFANKRAIEELLSDPQNSLIIYFAENSTINDLKSQLTHVERSFETVGREIESICRTMRILKHEIEKRENDR